MNKDLIQILFDEVLGDGKVAVVDVTTEILVGDRVEATDGSWSSISTVIEIIHEFSEPMAFFEEGGYYRISKLRKVL